MEAGTFPKEELQSYVSKYFVPVKYLSGRDADQFARFEVFAEPAFLVLDNEGNEIYRKIGFFEASLLVEQLEKARKKAARRASRTMGGQ